MWMMEGLDARRIERAVARLGNSDAGFAWLGRTGLDMTFARSAGIGVEREDADGLVLIHPTRGRDGRRCLASFRAGLNDAFCPMSAGSPGSHFGDVAGDGAHILVVPDMAAVWRLERALGSPPRPYVCIAPLHSWGLPLEWRDADFWVGFGSVTLLVDDPIGGGPLIAAVGAAAGPRTRVATPPLGDTWRDATADAEFDRALLEAAIEDASPISHFLGRADDAVRSGVHAIDLFDLDAAGRLMRLVRVEERSAGLPTLTASTARCRLRHMVVRSDGMMLDIVAPPAPPGTPRTDRVLSLSDGTRLGRAPPAGACSRWDLASVSGFLAGCAGGDFASMGAELVDEITDELVAATGLDARSMRTAANFVAMTYVFQAFEELRVPVFAGASATDRVRLIRALARLCHAGHGVGRSRARTLARLSDDTGGTILLDDPGPLAAANGVTEMGRFLLASSMYGAALDHDSTGGGGSRALRLFGPRAVFVERFGTVALGDLELRMPLVRERAPRPLDEQRCRDLVDRLYCWSMTAVEATRSLADGDRAKMLVAVADLARCENSGLAGKPDSVSRDGPPATVAIDAEEVMAEALAACSADDAVQFSITRMLMEIAIRGGVGPEFSPERVGRWLTSSCALDPGAEPTRRRLYGHIVRIYTLRATGAETVGDPVDPLDFCVATRCGECDFRNVCEAVVPGLKARRATRE